MKIKRKIAYRMAIILLISNVLSMGNFDLFGNIPSMICVNAASPTIALSGDLEGFNCVTYYKEGFGNIAELRGYEGNKDSIHIPSTVNIGGITHRVAIGHSTWDDTIVNPSNERYAKHIDALKKITSLTIDEVILLDVWFPLISIKNLDLSNTVEGWENIGFYFGGGNNNHDVEEITLPRFKIKLTRASGDVFAFLNSLKRINNITSLDTSELHDMFNMFAYCSSLEQIDVSGFDTTNVTSMNSMFRGCTALREIDISGFNMQNVSDINDMFANCVSLQTIKMPQSIGGDNLRSSFCVFENCKSLKKIDLSGFKRSINNDPYNFFNGCTSLRDIKELSLN